MLGAVLSGAGALKSLFGGDSSAGYYRAAGQSLKSKQALIDYMTQLAKNYDPHAETQTAVNYASGVAGQQLGQTLSGLDQQYAASGGQSTGDTRFRVSAQGATDRALDPLKQFAAERSSGELMAKLNALKTAATADSGQVANTYASLAGATTPNYGGALQSLSGAIDALTKRPNSVGTSTGSVLGGVSNDALTPAPVDPADPRFKMRQPTNFSYSSGSGFKGLNFG